MTNPKVAIIILNWNGLKDTIECLESINKISYPDYKIVVIDNGSSGDDAAQIKEKFTDSIYLIRSPRNEGYAGGVNTGIRYAWENIKPDYFLLLNNDTIVDTEFLTRLVEAAEFSNDIGIISAAGSTNGIPVKGEVLGAKLKMWLTCFGISEINVWQSGKQKKAGFNSACCLIKKEVVAKIGLFNESYFCYWEDIEYCDRVIKGGYTIGGEPKAKIWHKVGQTAKQNGGLAAYYNARNRLKFIKEHATKTRYILLVLYTFIIYLEIVTIYQLINRNLDGVIGCTRGIWDGIRGQNAYAKLYGDNRV